MRVNTGRVRANKLYPILGLCEADGCLSDAYDRHHIDGDTFNNARENLKFLCRRCHMLADGRMERFVAAGGWRAVERSPTMCSNCGKPATPARKGRCHACNEYLRRNGSERPRRLYDGSVQ